MKVLAYTGVGSQITANSWVPITLPMAFNPQDSTGDRASLEKEFGIVMDPSGKCAVINNSNGPVHLMLTMSAHFAGNTNWSRPVALGVFNQPVTANFDVKSLVSASSMNYQNNVGNVAVMSGILPVLLAGQSLYFAVGAYDGIQMLDLTLRFGKLGA